MARITLISVAGIIGIGAVAVAGCSPSKSTPGSAPTIGGRNATAATGGPSTAAGGAQNTAAAPGGAGAGAGAGAGGSAEEADPPAMSGSPSTAQQPSESRPAPGDPAGSGIVPAAIQGTWSGIAYPAGGVQTSVTVTIVQGNVGETVEHSAVTYTYINTSCGGQGVLVSASAQEIVVTNSNSSTNAMCGDLEGTAPVRVTYRLNTSGTLQATIGTSTAELTKQR